MYGVWLKFLGLKVEVATFPIFYRIDNEDLGIYPNIFCNGTLKNSGCI